MVSFLHWYSTPIFIFIFMQILVFIMVGRTVQGFELTFPKELWNICQQICDNMPRTNNSVEGFHNIIQCSVTSVHSGIGN